MLNKEIWRKSLKENRKTVGKRKILRKMCERKTERERERERETEKLNV